MSGGQNAGMIKREQAQAPQPAATSTEATLAKFIAEVSATYPTKQLVDPKLLAEFVTSVELNQFGMIDAKPLFEKIKPLKQVLNELVQRFKETFRSFTANIPESDPMFEVESKPH